MFLERRWRNFVFTM